MTLGVTSSLLSFASPSTEMTKVVISSVNTSSSLPPLMDITTCKKNLQKQKWMTNPKRQKKHLTTPTSQLFVPPKVLLSPLIVSELNRADVAIEDQVILGEPST